MTSPTMRTPRLGVSYSEAIATAYSTAPEEEIIFDTLEFQHPSFADDGGGSGGGGDGGDSGGPGGDDPGRFLSTVRVVNDHVDLVAGLEGTGEMVTFTACYFKFTRPEESASSSMPEVQIQVDNIANILIPRLKGAIQSRVPIKMIWRPYLQSDLSGPHMLPVLTLTLRSIKTNMNSMTATAGFTDLSNRRFPANEYTSRLFPGLVVR